MSAYFITGTDTNVGKTWTTLALMQAAQEQGKIVAGMKPIASGCQQSPDGLRNNDALKLLKQSSKAASYTTINPYAFAEKVGPHIAAERTGVNINIDKITAKFELLKQNNDIVFVEGIGGWCVPLAQDLMLADLVKKLALPVILVIGLRLGCINHALSAARAIQADGVTLHGWIISHIESNYISYTETLATLEQQIQANFLGSIPYMERFDVKKATRHITL